MAKINITRSQVAQLYVELTSDNLKEVFIVEGDAVIDPVPVNPEPQEEIIVPATEETIAPETAVEETPTAAEPAPEPIV